MASSNLPFRLQLVAVLLLLGLGYFVADSMTQRIVEKGDRAPNFKIVTDGGRTLSRSDFGGKVLVLNFWATWCPPCIEELPTLSAMQQQLAGDGVVVLAVSVDKNEKTYKDFLQRAKVSFLTAHDPQADISAEYGTFKYPETYIINREGKVVEKFISNQNWMDPQIIQQIRSAM
jgi:cytochrome c biogenesis protein CcmG, thiol:disulfide interchange protein DsbE